MTIFIFLLNLGFFCIGQLAGLDGKLKYHVEAITLLRGRQAGGGREPDRQTHRLTDTQAGEGDRQRDREAGRQAGRAREGDRLIDRQAGEGGRQAD